MTPFEKIFQALNEEEVQYIVVGGLAVVLHGHLRTTADIDLVVLLEQQNAAAAVRSLKKLGYQPRPPVPFEDFADADKRAAWIKDKGLTVFSTHSTNFPGIEVDLFVEEPFIFADAFSRASKVQLEKTTVVVASIDDLIAMKKQVNRPIDQSDIHVLESIKDRQSNKDEE